MAGSGSTTRSPALVDGSGRLLGLLRKDVGRTISTLATQMGVSRSTVIQRLEFLAAAGLVESEVVSEGARGRPASITKFNPAAGIVLATQIGLTGCRLAATDLSGDVIAEDYIAVEFSTGAAALLRDLEEHFDRMLEPTELASIPVVGVGVGIPSAVELQGYARGLGLAGLDWDRETFRRGLREHFEAPVFLDLDVNLLAMAEWRNSWPDVEACVCVKLGTLIDAAIVVNGAPVRGAAGLAGELGHIKVNGSTTPCSCGSQGCLDAVASGDALVRQLKATGAAVSHVSDVVELAHEGDPRAIMAIREAGRRIGEALSSVVNLLNPAVISTWGYLTDADSPLFAGIREGLYQSALPGSSDSLTLVKTALGDLAGARGAAMLVLDEVLSESAVDRMLVTRSWIEAADDLEQVS